VKHRPAVRKSWATADEGYQRVLSPARQKAIGAFIDKGNYLPTAILLSFKSAKIVRRKGHTFLQVPNKPNAGWVIDGQHRLGGAHVAASDITLPMVAFVNLPLDKQISCFITINKEQKGVPSSLYLDLLKKLPQRRSPADIAKERAADLADRLKRDPESPFFERIVVTVSPREGQLSLTNFVRKLQPMVRANGVLHIYRDDEREGILNNYYLGLREVFPNAYTPNDSVFFKTLGFGALMNALPFVLSLAINHFHSFRIGDVVSVFREIDYFDFGAWKKIGTGTEAENSASDDLKSELETAFAETSEVGSIVLR
jgi:DGQHR domain-containing protein